MDYLLCTHYGEGILHNQPFVIYSVPHQEHRSTKAYTSSAGTSPRKRPTCSASGIAAGAESSAADARKWPNILLISKLLFSLPFTNSSVERTFSTMKVMKTDRRTSLHTSTLDDLFEINVEGPPAESFCSDQVIQLWWSDRTRRPNQAPRKEYRKRLSSEADPETSTIESENTEFTLNAWDAWFTESDSDSD